VNRKPRLVLCSGVDVPGDDSLREGRHVLELNAYGPQANVTVKLEDVAKVICRHLTGRLADLLEIAAYIYAADCSTNRDGWRESNSTEAWKRDFTFVIPVRDVAFWQRSDVNDLLAKLIQFLSNDTCRFDFRELTQTRDVQGYLEFGEEDWPFYDVERVIMFSGGLDSLTGAVETVHSGERLVLISHRPVSILDKRQRELFEKLREAYGNAMTRIPVWVNKDSKISSEYTQRTRSFLFSALGTVVAASVRAKGVRFFENGIVSLNFPMSDEALQARASRTTHPISLHYFTELYRLLLDNADFIVDNPFIFKTKAEVVTLLAEKGQTDLIGYTCSCAHTGPYKQKGQQHCGACSQCIDRRIAVIAAGQAEHDPEEDYAVDVFTGPRKEKYEQAIGVQYIRHSQLLSQMTPEQMAQEFNIELSRAIRYLPENRKEGALSAPVVKCTTLRVKSAHS
jgi:7-cyano-7-deazaguanine synthase in queuosine biosynthesis